MLRLSLDQSSTDLKGVGGIINLLKSTHMLDLQKKSDPRGSDEHLPLTLIIEGGEFQWNGQFVTGKEIRELANLSPDADLYLAIIDPWDDEPVSPETKVDLGREGIESFYVRNPLSFIFEGKNYQWKKQFISGHELRKVTGLSAQDEILLMLQKPYLDEIVEDKTQVDLARSGIEHFRVKKKNEDIIVLIRINDKPYSLKRGVHSVAELKRLGSVSAADELSELIKGKLMPLEDNASVHIKGNEEFFSCKREGTSS